MNSPVARRIPAIWATGLLVFVLLALRFSPNWFSFQSAYQVTLRQAPDAAHRAAVTAAFQNTVVTTRGVYVARQVVNLAAPIDDLNHKIVRWRLLMPALGHFLHLPSTVVLGLAHLGCLVFVVILVGLGFRGTDGSRRSLLDAGCLGAVGGASAPFVTSMGWLGYYDAWLAVSLVAAAFVRRRWVIVLILKNAVETRRTQRGYRRNQSGGAPGFLVGGWLR